MNLDWKNDGTTNSQFAPTMKKTYLFYDIETTGLSKAFDQVLQFACIRTDRQLNEIERCTIQVQLRPDVIPSPGAIITNRISVKDLKNLPCEFESICKIHQLLNQPGTVSVGYNSLGFDDEFLRFSFYRNLLPPYTHQYLNGCRRMDMLPMTVMFWLYKRNAINWPQFNFKPSLKLEHIREANQLANGPSHDATVDVSATVELARMFFKHKKMWNYLLGYFDKETDAHRIHNIPAAFQSALGEHRKALVISSEYGPGLMYQAPVLFIGNSIPYSNQTLWLRLDQPFLKKTKADTIDETTWIVRKRYGEPGILLPPNQRYLKFLSDERKADVAENLKWLQSNPAIFEKIVHYHREYRYPYISNLDPDAALYQIGFFTRPDEKLFKTFHAAAFDKKEQIINRLTSQDARELAIRLLCRNYPQQVSDNLRKEFQAYLRRVNPGRGKEAIKDYKGEPRLTPAQALSEIKHLKRSAGLDSHQLDLLNELRDYIKNNFARNKSGRQLSIGKNF